MNLNAPTFVFLGAFATGTIITATLFGAAFADGVGKTGTFDQCIEGDCDKPKLYFCQPLTKWVTAEEWKSGDCRSREQSEPERRDC